MNNEIKKILEELKNEDNYIEDYGFRYKRIALDDVWHLLDYITNLQNIIKEVREYIENTTYADITGLEKHSIKEFWFVKELLEILDKEK